jgi:predicted HicB family RNase H-like nuclease
MFRVRKVEETLNRTFRIPASLLERLSVTAQNENVSVNQLVIQCCEYALNDLNQDTSNNIRLKVVN